MYTKLKYFYDLFMSASLTDTCTFLSTIYSLAHMMSITLSKYDELYYFEYKDNKTGEHKFHTDHDKWINMIGKLRSKEYLDKLQDYFFLE